MGKRGGGGRQGRGRQSEQNQRPAESWPALNKKEDASNQNAGASGSGRRESSRPPPLQKLDVKDASGSKSSRSDGREDGKTDGKDKGEKPSTTEPPWRRERNEDQPRGRASSVVSTAEEEKEIQKRKESELLKEAEDIKERLTRLIEVARKPYNPRIDETLFDNEKGIMSKPDQTGVEDEFQDCEETATACETAGGEEHAKGEVLVKKNLHKLLEAHSTVIVELPVPKEVMSKHQVLARVSGRIDLLPDSALCKSGDASERGHKDLDLGANISLGRDVGNPEGPHVFI